MVATATLISTCTCTFDARCFAPYDEADIVMVRKWLRRKGPDGLVRGEFGLRLLATLDASKAER